MATDAVGIGKLEHPGIDDNHSDEIKRRDTFEHTYHLAVEQAVGLDNTYITDISIKESPSNIQIAAALSNKSSAVYNFSNNQFSFITTLKGHEKPISNVRISQKSENLVYTASLDGRIKLWDLRKENCVKELKDENGIKPLTCFDVSCDDRLICAGTELVDGDAFILFWDIRSRKLLGGYWESHTDDLTQIVFHPDKPEFVATGSTDGLINLFDITKTSEEDALSHSLNTESSVAKVRWHGNTRLSCLTHTEAVQLWSVDGAGPEVQFTREKVAEALQRSQINDSYLIDVQQNSNDELFLLTGATSGKGEVLKMFAIEKNKLVPSTEFVGNRQIIRCSSYIKETKMLFTAGESGCISVWKPGQATEKSSGTALKKLSKQRNKHKPKPY
ncbi:UNVERIFIED_CONTAM: hypothetical protein PYX00_000692 [Menopon gallinae]|uniref:WD repeat-containing protein 89 n=1 Tax=Menopon gallinae TaxID=328185 RepID=A0AAW2IA07_9NEOP